MRRKGYKTINRVFYKEARETMVCAEKEVVNYVINVLGKGYCRKCSQF
jgi:hypothetical protein